MANLITAEQVKDFRQRRGMTQAQLAEAAACTPQNVRARWEQNGIPAKKVMEAMVIVAMFTENLIGEIE